MKGFSVFLVGMLAMSTNAKVNERKLFINTKIFNGQASEVSADSFLIEDGLIKKIGKSNELLARFKKNTQVLDLKGALSMPGFIESHAHLIGLGQSKIMLDLRGLSPVQILERLKAQSKAQAHGTWITGRGWDQNLWPLKRFPNKDMLKDIHNPVLLKRVDGHAIWVNQAAMDMVGVNGLIENPKGGQIIRDQNGAPTGVFLDRAMELISSYLKKPGHKDLELYLDLGIKEALSRGITSFHDAGASREELKLFAEQARAGALKMRIYAMIDGQDEDLVDEYLEAGPLFINNMLTIRTIKYFADGALGSRGALLLNDYHDAPKNRGLELISPKDIERKTTRAIHKGFQVATHAIGDAANRLVLNAYEAALLKTQAKDARLRIEHAQLVDPIDHHRFKQLGVIASMQPIHCISDMAWVRERVSPELLQDRAYPWRSLQKSGARLVFGSDAPVEDINPILGLYALVSRTDLVDRFKKSFMPEQKLTLRQALNGYFADAAFSEFSEDKKGKIKEGYWADIVVFDTDIIHPERRDFLEAVPLMSMVGGQIVFQR